MQQQQQQQQQLLAHHQRMQQQQQQQQQRQHGGQLQYQGFQGSGASDVRTRPPQFNVASFNTLRDGSAAMDESAGWAQQAPPMPYMAQQQPGQVAMGQQGHLHGDMGMFAPAKKNMGGGQPQQLGDYHGHHMHGGFTKPGFVSQQDTGALASVGTAPIQDPFSGDWEDFTSGQTNKGIMPQAGLFHQNSFAPNSMTAMHSRSFDSVW